MGMLFDWWNAVYTLPLALVLVLLTVTSLVSLVGGAFDGGGDADAGGADADGDLDADVDVDVDVDGDLDGDGDHDVIDRAIALHVEQPLAHGDAARHPDLAAQTLAWLGVGRMPAMMLFQVLFLFWGLTGFALHQAFRVAGPGALLWSVPVTLVVSVTAARTLAGLFARFFKPYESTGKRRCELVGREGTVVYAVTAEEGTVSVRDVNGTLHRFRARTDRGRLEPGAAIVVTGYDPKTGLYQVDDSESFLVRS